MKRVPVTVPQGTTFGAGHSFSLWRPVEVTFDPGEVSENECPAPLHLDGRVGNGENEYPAPLPSIAALDSPGRASHHAERKFLVWDQSKTGGNYESGVHCDH
jgi:hypothetical protein